MDYIELIITVSGDVALGRDITLAQLAESGYESFEETDTGLKAYIPRHLFHKDPLEKLMILSDQGFTGSFFKYSEIETVNWNTEWENNYQPVSVGDFCHIRAIFHPSSGNFRHEIIIQPKMSFGTGHHETTWLMVESMQNISFTGKRVLDLGCGTGVLAILASLMGASSVTAVDIDEWSVENTKENIKTNNRTNISVIHGDINMIPHEALFDVILANITRNVLTQYMNRMAGMLGSDGLIVMSGFYTEDIDAITVSAVNAGMSPVTTAFRNRWATALFKN